MSRSNQKGLKYGMEGYIRDFKINMVGKEINLEARVCRLQRKQEKPHVTVILATFRINTSCTAG